MEGTPQIKVKRGVAWILEPEMRGKLGEVNAYVI